jgi:hypothetical protein
MIKQIADHRGLAVWGMNCLRSHERCDLGFDATWGMDVCVCVYSVFVLLCLYVAVLRRTDHLSKESYRLCKKYYESEDDAWAQLKAVQPLMHVSTNHN